MPGVAAVDDIGGRRRTPGAGFVFEHGQAALQHRIHHPPCGFHAVVLREQAMYRRARRRPAVAHREISRPAEWWRAINSTGSPRMSFAVEFHQCALANHHLGAQAQAEIIRRHVRRWDRKSPSGGRLRVTLTSVAVIGRHLAGADVERHAGPAPGVDVQAQRGEGLDLRILGHAGLVAIAAELSAHHLLRIERPHRAEKAQLLRLHGLRVVAGGRIHREQRHHLQQMVLHHVADRADFLVEGAAALNAEILRPW